MVLNDDNTIVITSNRLAETGAPLLEQGMIVGQLSLADALIIGNCNNQVKNCEGIMLKIQFENQHFLIIIELRVNITELQIPCKYPKSICEEMFN